VLTAPRIRRKKGQYWNSSGRPFASFSGVKDDLAEHVALLQLGKAY
jgi:hypothetical protein